MSKTLPKRFLPADPESPCVRCEKTRKTCRFCERCSGCCQCPICPNCQGADTDYGQTAQWFIKEVGKECNCELCYAWPAKGCLGRIDRDMGSYAPNPSGGCDLMYCPKCAKRVGLE